VTENYKPKVGDRVRVTHEGEIQAVDKNRVLYRVGSGRTFTWFDSGDPKGVVVEKLQDPEPEWVNGDVIHIIPYVEGYRIGGKWLHADGEVHWWSRGGGDVIPRAWATGKLEILYKADQQKEVV
jgi:hypothetical protein